MLASSKSADVSILTFHDGINYGAFFQTFAMYTYLSQKGFSTEVINYKNIDFTQREYRVFLTPRSQSFKSIIQNILKIYKFRRALRKIRLTKRIFTKKAIERMKFDRVVIGSDEVWNCSTYLIGVDEVYFGNGINANSITAFSPSFGIADSIEKIPENLQQALGRIDNVSVRDVTSAQVMAKMTDKEVHLTLDPTFLIDLPRYAVVPAEKNFILLYGHYSEIMRDKIQKFAHDIGKKTISVCYENRWCDVTLESVDPFVWLGYFASCDLVITSMYHGTLFSLHNNKPFGVINTSVRKNKINDLLDFFDLKARLIDEETSLEEFFSNSIDYSKVNETTLKNRRKSENYLLTSLNYNPNGDS